MNAKSGRPPNADGYHQNGLCESDYWKHRARVAETQLAGREPFWLARGRLLARAHTWRYADGTAEPGVALLDRQGRLRGDLTTGQARRLVKDMTRILERNTQENNDGRTRQMTTQSETATKPARRMLYKSTADHDLVVHRSDSDVEVTLEAGECLPLHNEYETEELEHLIEQGSVIGIEMEEIIDGLWASTETKGA